jgi:hypothetical protein
MSTLGKIRIRSRTVTDWPTGSGSVPTKGLRIRRSGSEKKYLRIHMYLPVIGLPDELVVILGLVRAAVIKLGMIGHLMV